jgi:hypothetical protein
MYVIFVTNKSNIKAMCQYILETGVAVLINFDRRKIRFIEGNRKCRHLKKLTSNGTLRQVFICLRPRTP